MIRLLRTIFVHDWPLKLFSLLLAVLTWLTVHFSLRQQVVPVPGNQSLSAKTYFDLPVTIVSANMDVSSYKVEPKEVDVTFQGSKEALEEFPRSSFRIIVDLSGTVLKAAQQLPVEVIAPAGITYAHIAPESLVRVIPPPPPATETQPEKSE
jgi:YbbR domain-containing protein